MTQIITKRKNFVNKGQASLEFTFCMIIVLLMIFGLMMVFRWVGVNMAEGRIAHDTTLTTGTPREIESRLSGPLQQVKPYFYKPVKMNAVWDGF